MRRAIVGAALLCVLCASSVGAQNVEQPASPAAVPAQSPSLPDPEAPLSGFLSRAYFSLNVGAIDYSFSSEQLEPGHTASDVSVSHGAVRLVLLGFRFNRYISGEVSYGRPVQYVRYHNVDNDGQTHSVSVAIGGLMVRGRYPFTPKVSIYGEGGLNITTRKGFEINGETIVADTHIGAFVAGSGLEYHFNDRWDLLGGLSYATGRTPKRQPEMLFASTGIRYNMRSVTRDPASEDDGFFFPNRTMQLGYTSKGLGYGVNNIVSSKIPIFWGGDVPVSSGGIIRYQKRTFHSRKVFSFDIGGSLGLWAGDGTGRRFTTVSAYPLLRFMLWRTQPADLYMTYSAAGPTFITSTLVDGRETGTHFTFQDMLGAGAYLTRKRNMVAELSIGHYSNGNLFFQNPGIKIPLTFSIGYVF